MVLTLSVSPSLLWREEGQEALRALPATQVPPECHREQMRARAQAPAVSAGTQQSLPSAQLVKNMPVMQESWV